MLEKIKNLLVKFFEHIGPEKSDTQELNSHKELYVYMLAMLADEFLGCLVFVSYMEKAIQNEEGIFESLFFIKDIVLISDNDVYSINLFDDDRWIINKESMKDIVSGSEYSCFLVRVSGTDKDYEWSIEDGLEGKNTKPHHTLFRKFDKILQSFPKTILTEDI